MTLRVLVNIDESSELSDVLRGPDNYKVCDKDGLSEVEVLEVADVVVEDSR